MRFRTGSGAARRVLAIAAVAAIAATAGCGGNEEGGGTAASSAPPQNVTLRFNFWGNADRADLTNKAVAKFSEKYPHIKVETSFAEFGAYFTKLATEISGGNAPDVLQMDFRYLREYGERRQLAELNKGGVNVNVDEISDSLLTSGKIGGKLYAIPVGQNTQIFSYDAAQWKAAGATLPTENWTWDDLKASAQKVSDFTKGAVRGINDPGGIEDWFEVKLRQDGKLLYTDEGKLGYTAKEVADWWTLTDGWRKSGATTLAEQTSKADGSLANDPVAKKQASSGFGYDSGLTAKSWELLGREMTIHNFPSNKADTLGQYAKPAMQFAVSEKSTHKKEAAQLIDFIINDPDAAQILGMSRGLPVNQKNQEAVGAKLTGPPAAGYAFEKKIAPRLKDAPPPPPKGSGTVKIAFQRIYDDVIFGRKTPQAAADAFMTEAKQTLGQ
ncbi:MAG TPA: extracellular solute-binding protein [Micromonosporaceae bacterium]|nr:extracellular solute-binding protein [Micromonosporaceae bacterium]